MTDNRMTELLCKLLEERGIEWKDGDAAYEIEWSTPDGRHCSAMYWKPTFTVLISGCTPDQAIAATLGMSNESIKVLIDDMLCFIDNCCETTLDCDCCDPIDCKYLSGNDEFAECTRYQDFLSRAKAIAATLETKRDRTEERLLNACNNAANDYIAELERKLEAVALGGGKLTADDIRDLIERHSDASGGNGRDFHNGAYEAIADELNTAIGGGECENLAGYPLVNFECSECGCEVYGGDELGANIENGRWNWCPNCRKAVKR